MTELKKIVAGFTKGIIGENTESNCFIVCLPLQSYLSFCGYETKLVEGELLLNGELHHHFWIELKDGKIIDPTANQFNKIENKAMPKIYIGEKPYWYISQIKTMTNDTGTEKNY